MTSSPVAFIELFVVLMFLAAWGVLELVGRRLDRKRDAERKGAEQAPDDTRDRP